MRRVTPTLHHVEYGEAVTWTPPAGAVKFLAWTQPRVFTHDDPSPNEELAYGGAAPAWTEAGGFDIARSAKITPEGKGRPLSGFEATATGVTATWAALLTLAQGVLTEIVQIIAYGADGKAISIDRYAVPAPSSTDAAMIAAQERRVLQHLLASREAIATRGGVKAQTRGEADQLEYMDLPVIDRRIAEVRARIAWFDQAASGNILPRAELW